MIEMGGNQLNNSDILFKTIYDDSPIGIELYDSNGKLLDLNASCMELFGVSSKDDVKGFDLLNDPNIPIENITKLKRRETVNYESVFDFELVKDKNLYRTNKSGKIYLDILITPLCAGEEKSISNYLVQIRDITGQKIAERKLIDLNEELEHRIEERTEKLRKSEANWRFLVEEAPDIIFTVDRNNRILFINNVPEGITREEAIGTKVLDYVSPEYHETVENSIEKVFQTGKSDYYEISARGPDDNPSWYSTRLGAIKQDEEVVSVMLITRDITERKNMEQKLKESEEKYRNLFNDLNVGLFQSRISDGKFLECNDFFAKMVGYNTREECLTDYVASEHYIDPSVREGMLKEINAHGEVRNFEAYLTKKDGTPFWGNYSARIYPDRNIIEGAAVDITKRKKAEEEIMKFKRVSDNANYGIGIIDLDGILVYSNEYFATIHGYNPDELIGKTFNIFHSKEQLKQVMELRQKLQDEGSYNAEEVWHKHRDGSIFPMLMNGITIKDDKGNPIFMAATAIEITERKKTEKKLRESEEKFRTISDQSLVGIIIAQNGIIKYVNKQMEALSGYSIEELKSWKAGEFIKIIHPNYRDLVAEQSTKKQMGLDSVIDQYQFMGIKKSGEYIWVDDYSKTIEYEGSNAVLSIMIDITEKKEAEQKLKDSEEKYRTLIDSISDIIFEIDLDGNVSYLSPQTINILGYNPEELINKNAFSFIHPDDQEVVLENQNYMINSGEIVSTEFRLRHKNGHFITVSSRGQLVENNNKKKIVGLFRDITGHKNTEQKLRESEEQYKNLNNELETVLDIIPGILFCKDRNGVVTRTNQVFAESLNLNKEDIIGKTAFDLFPKDQAEAFQTDDLEVISSGNPKLNIEESADFHDGTIWAITNKIPYYNKEGEINGIIGLSVDITERKKIEQELKESEEKFRSITEQSILGIVIVQDDIVKYANHQIADIYGYSIEEIMNWSSYEFLKIIDPEYREIIKEQARKKQLGHKDVLNHYQFRCIKKTGEKIWVENHSRTINYNGKPADMVTLIDVTDKKEAEQKLKESEEKYRNFIENFQGIAFQGYQDFTAAFFHGEVENITGYNEDDFVSGRINWNQIIHPDDVNEINKKVKEFHERLDETEKRKYRIICKDGNIRWLTEYNQKFYDEVLNKEGVRGVIIDITESRKIEEKVYQEREKAEMYLNLVNVLIVALDGHGNISMINQKGIDFLGWNEGELIGKSWFENCLPPEDRDRVNDYFKKLMKGELDVIPFYENSVITKKGDEKLIAWSTILFRDSNGKIIGLLSSGEDITDRKKVENELKESKQLLETTLYNLQDAIFILDDKIPPKVIECNPASEKIFGYSRNEVIGNTTTFLHVDENSLKAFQNQVLPKLQQSGNVHNFEFKMKRKNGNIFPSEHAISVLRNENGATIGNVSLVRDITDRKKSEEKLRDSEKKLRDLIEAVPIGISISTPEGKIIESNSKAFQIYGYNSKEDFLRTPVINLYRNPSERERFIVLHKRGLVKDFEAEFKRKDGSVFWGSLTSIAHNVGNQTTFINSFQDITNRKLAEIKIQQSEAELTAIYNYTPIAILLVDNERRIRKINKFALKLTDRQEEEVFGIHGGEALRCLYSIKDPRGCGFSEYCQDCTIRNTILDTFKTKIPHINVEATLYQLPGGDIDKTHLLISTVPLKFDEEDLVLISFIDITDRMNAEQKLKKSEERFKYLVSSSPAIIYTSKVSGDYGTTFISDNVQEKWGYSSEYFINDSDFWLNQVHPDDKEEVLSILSELFEKEHVIYDYRFKLSNGTYRWMRDEVDLVKDEVGNPIETIGSVKDINDRKEAEQELKESETRYRELFENSPIALFEQDFSKLKSYIDDLKALGITDFERYFEENPEEILNFSLLIELIDVNKKTLELYNARTKDDFVERKSQMKKDIFKYFSPEVLLANKREIISLINGDSTFESEVSTKTFTGEPIFLYMKTLIIPGYENSWSKVIVSLLDITDRIKVEQKLKESEEKFRTIAEESALGVIIQQEALIKFVSPAVSDILEYPIEEINEWTVEDTLKIIHVDDLQLIKEKTRARNNSDYTTIINYECRITTKFGNLKWIEVMSKPIIFLGKRAILISMIDITTKKEVEEELKEVSKLKSELLSRTSHELKTPLVSIKGYVDLLLQVHYDHLDYYTISMLHEIRQGCSRLGSLIKDLLETSKLETGSIVLRKEKENLSFLIKFCIRELQGLTRIRKHEILVDIDEKMETMFEKERIYEVIINLLSNAIKYTPPKGLIKIGSEIKNNEYIISIEDNGIGLSELDREKIFKKFGKIERYGKGLDVVSEGSGLGLYISKGIIELHDGRIWVESKGNKNGSTFYFSLPIIND